MAGPANTIASFCQSGFAPSASLGWARTSGSSASSGFSPSILTKPPSGNHAIAYSVPFRVQASRQRPMPIGGPKPRQNLSTRTPHQRATRKWPSSCTKISTREHQHEGEDVGEGGHALRASSCPSHSRAQARAQRVGLDHVAEPRERPRAGARLEGLQHGGVGGGDRGERDAAREEGRDGHLVGGVQHRRRRLRARAAPGRRDRGTGSACGRGPRTRAGRAQPGRGAGDRAGGARDARAPRRSERACPAAPAARAPSRR